MRLTTTRRHRSLHQQSIDVLPLHTPFAAQEEDARLARLANDAVRNVLRRDEHRTRQGRTAARNARTLDLAAAPTRLQTHQARAEPPPRRMVGTRLDAFQLTRRVARSTLTRFNDEMEARDIVQSELTRRMQVFLSDRYPGSLAEWEYNIDSQSDIPNAEEVLTLTARRPR